MFKVECPGCKAPYQVDERRIPSTGLKMRCPKCGTSFKVEAPADAYRTGPTPVLGGPIGPDAEPEKPRPSPAALKGTMLGVAPAGAPLGPPPVPKKDALPAELPRPAPEMDARSPEPAPAFDDPYGEVDLPAVGTKAGTNTGQVTDPAADLPSPVLPKTAGGAISLELDLPSPVSEREPILDLPTVPSRSAAAPADLPDVAARRAPEPGRLRDFGEIDLPSVSQSTSNLPAVLGSDRSATRGGAEIELPSLSQGALPAVSASGLPSAGGAGLPSAGGPGLLSRAGSGSSAPGPVASPPQGLSSPPGGFGELELPEIGPPSAPGRGTDDQFGELELPLIGSDRPRPLDEPRLDPAPPASAERDSARPREAVPTSRPPEGEVVRQGGGGTSYGEVNLDPGASQPVPISDPPAPGPDDDMEFGAIPQEDERRPGVRSEPIRVHAAGPTSEPPGRRRRLGLRVFAGILGLTVGGASLALVPSLGPFGAYWITDKLKASEYEQLVESARATALSRMAKDTHPDARAALETLDGARSDARRVKALAAYAAYLGYARELRFGAEPAVHARSNVLLDELSDAPDVEHLELARTARAATEGQLARARQLLSALERRRAERIEVLVLRGELELKARDAKTALAAWEKAATREKSARTSFGLARAKHAAGDIPGAKAEAERTLAQNPAHVGARLLLAHIGKSDREGEKRAMETLLEITKAPAQASPEEIVSAQTLLGDIHLSRSRISLAEAAYNEALRINPKAARALTGLGDALCRAGRYSEAQARFEAGAQADPDDILAKVGVAKSKLALERVEDASQILKKLRLSHPKSVLVAYWYGRVLEALGNRAEAESVYREALESAPQDPLIVDVYIALALLQNQEGRVDEARQTLDAAQKGLPPSSSIHKALGEVALSQGRYQAAVAELERAVELDADDLGSRFKLGSALRRDGKYEEASRVFDEVAAVDREYPGLALELGLLYEASGRADEALKQYEGALAKAPNDPDLMLRVGCGKVAAGLTKQAEELLRKVLSQRPTSAETNHCLGRALLVEGTRLADALRALERAAELDPHRAEYHLYVGWAANEAGNVPKAERALDQALKLDQGLADAYWQRGVLRQRQGAVRDAIADLVKALELRPTRYEAHAALAEAYYDLGKEPRALAEWQLAVAAKPDNANWRFRYGKLLTANRMNEPAQEHLRKAIELGAAMDPDPRWLWEAHHMMARSLGGRPEAAQHWEQFLRLGPRDSPYRAEAKAALEKLGRPWSGD